MVDWFRVFSDLKGRQVTVRMLARKARVSISTINAWKAGACEPRYSTGVMLIELWSRRTGTPVDKFPRV
ncbi:hypothetical protein [Thiothrix sp.]|jgi:predicted transcriptional regulator|uniref:hypothetical protein n=1 Tax=Thiothrix sp. TaxID=1032 RepID=UPI00257DCB1B|nr:hypothetical protein [Thiothrix sp.]